MHNPVLLSSSIINVQDLRRWIVHDRNARRWSVSAKRFVFSRTGASDCLELSNGNVIVRGMSLVGNIASPATAGEAGEAS